MKRQWLGAVCLSTAASIWGGMYVVSKYVLEFVPPFTLLWLRYVIGFVVLLAVMLYRRYPMPERKALFTFAWIGFIGYFVSVGAQFVGTALSSAHMGAVITSASPALTLVFAWWLLKESLTVKKSTAVAVASVGVLIVIGYETGESEFWGNIVLVVAAVTWALLSVSVRKASSEYRSLAITTYAILFAVLFTTPVMLYELEVSDVQLTGDKWVWPGILYLGVISTALAFFLWNKGLELMEASIGSLFFFFQPVVGAFLGWLLLNEALHWNFYLGGLFIVVGVSLATYSKKQYPRTREL